MDTVLASALSDGTPLPSAKGVASMQLSPALVLQVIVRLAAAMYAQIPHLNLKQQTVPLHGAKRFSGAKRFLCVGSTQRVHI